MACEQFFGKAFVASRSLFTTKRHMFSRVYIYIYIYIFVSFHFRRDNLFSHWKNSCFVIRRPYSVPRLRSVISGCWVYLPAELGECCPVTDSRWQEASCGVLNLEILVQAPCSLFHHCSLWASLDNDAAASLPHPYGKCQISALINTKFSTGRSIEKEQQQKKSQQNNINTTKLSGWFVSAYSVSWC